MRREGDPSGPEGAPRLSSENHTQENLTKPPAQPPRGVSPFAGSEYGDGATRKMALAPRIAPITQKDKREEPPQWRLRAIAMVTTGAGSKYPAATRLNSRWVSTQT